MVIELELVCFTVCWFYYNGRSALVYRCVYFIVCLPQLMNRASVSRMSDVRVGASVIKLETWFYLLFSRFITLKCVRYLQKTRCSGAKRFCQRLVLELLFVLLVQKRRSGKRKSGFSVCRGILPSWVAWFPFISSEVTIDECHRIWTKIWRWRKPPTFWHPVLY